MSATERLKSTATSELKGIREFWTGLKPRTKRAIGLFFLASLSLTLLIGCGGADLGRNSLAYSTEDGKSHTQIILRDSLNRLPQLNRVLDLTSATVKDYDKTFGPCPWPIQIGSVPPDEERRMLKRGVLEHSAPGIISFVPGYYFVGDDGTDLWLYQNTLWHSLHHGCINPKPTIFDNPVPLKNGDHLVGVQGFTLLITDRAGFPRQDPSIEEAAIEDVAISTLNTYRSASPGYERMARFAYWLRGTLSPRDVSGMIRNNGLIDYAVQVTGTTVNPEDLVDFALIARSLEEGRITLEKAQNEISLIPPLK